MNKGVFYIDSDIYDDFDKIVASDTVLKYVEGFRDKDIEKIKATVPEELSKAKGVDSIFNSEAEGKIKGLSYEIDKLVYLYTDV